MKKLFRSALVVAAFATIFTACSKDNAEAPSQAPREKEMTIVTSSETSRTALDPATNTISWNASGEFLKVFQTTSSTTTDATSSEGVISGGKASFGVTFTANTTDNSFTYNAVYPASAWITDSNTKVDNLKIITPTTQQPSATSFDSAADLLIALPETYAVQPDQLNMRFARIVAIGKMTIKNLNTTEQISSIKFQANNQVLTGRSYVDLTSGTVTEYGYTPYDNVILDYTGKEIAANGMTAYFACFPFQLAEGETFTVTINTATKRFTKTVTLAGRTLAFKAGESSTFAVDMNGIVGENTVADLRNATLTFDEIKAVGGTGNDKSWGTYGKLYEYTQENGAIWGIMAYYQNTYIQLGATDRESYIKLPDFSKPITAVTVTLNKVLSGKNLYLTSGPAITTGDIGTATNTGTEKTVTFNIADKNVNTAYLRAESTSQVLKIEAYAGAAIVAPAKIAITAEGTTDEFTYTTAAFDAADDTSVTFDGTVVELAEVDVPTKTVSYLVGANTDFSAGRTGTITLRSQANDATAIVKVEQAANVLTVPSEVEQLGGNAGDKISFSVTTAFPQLAYEGTNASFTIAQQGNAVTNANGTYTYTYTVTAANAGGAAEATLGTLTFYQTVSGQRIEPTVAATVPIVQVAAGSTISKTYTLDFADKTGQENSQSYTTTWSKTVGNYTWSIANFNNNNNGWDYIKCGRKTANSTASITTNWAIPEPMTKVIVTVDAYTTVSGCTSDLQVATDADFTQNLQTISGTMAKGDMTYIIPNPTANCYYKLVYNCPKKSNGYIQISKVVYTTD